MIGDKKEQEIQIALPDGRVVPAVEMKFEQKSEPWITLEVEDGTEIRVRLEVIKVFRMVNVFDPVTGEPVYFFNSNNSVRVHSPVGIRKKPSKPDNREVA
jgi:hypothetical protein